MIRKYVDKKFIAHVLFIALLVFAVYKIETILGFISYVIGVLSPLLFGCGLAYAVNVLMAPIERHLFPSATFKKARSVRRGLAIFLSLCMLAAIVAAVLYLVIPSLADTVVLLTESLQDLYTRFTNWIQENQTRFPELADFMSGLEWSSIVNAVSGFFSSGTGDIFTSAISMIGTFFTLVIDIIVAFVFMIYILFNKEKLASQVNRLLHAFIKDKHLTRIYHVLATAHHCFTSYIIGQVIEAAVLGLSCTLGMLIFGFPYAALVGCFIGVTALVPFVGAYVGGALGAIMIFTVSPIRALWFIVFLFVLQQIEDNLIYPRIVGTSIGLPGIWVIAAITIGGSIGGVLGMILGVPAFATVYKLLGEFVDHHSERKEAVRAEAGASAPTYAEAERAHHEKHGIEKGKRFKGLARLVSKLGKVKMTEGEKQDEASECDRGESETTDDT